MASVGTLWWTHGPPECAYTLWLSQKSDVTYSNKIQWKKFYSNPSWAQGKTLEWRPSWSNVHIFPVDVQNKWNVYKSIRPVVKVSQYTVSYPTRIFVCIHLWQFVLIIRLHVHLGERDRVQQCTTQYPEVLVSNALVLAKARETGILYRMSNSLDAQVSKCPNIQ